MSGTFKRPESVLVVVHTGDGRFLMLRRRAPAGFWQSVTGSLRWDEHDPAVAARRELREETGLEAGPELRDWAQRLKTALVTVDGVQKVALYGEQTPVVNVYVSMATLANFAIRPETIVATIGQQNSIVDSGEKQAGSRSWIASRSRIAESTMAGWRSKTP